MTDYFVYLLLKAVESFLVTLSSKLAERLAAPKKRARKKPAPSRRKRKGQA